MRRNTLSMTAVAACLALAGCAQEPTGQVAAIVDGDEITLQEINGELVEMRLPDGAAPEVARSIALQRVIDRRLLARIAREEGLDQTPEFFIRQRRLIDTMLIEQLSAKLQRSVDVPSDAEIEQFAADHPEAFEQRKILRVDQIQFAKFADPEDMNALKDDRSMDEVEQSLRAMGLQYERSDADMDTALLGVERLAQIRALPAGEPFILPGPRTNTVAVIRTERDAPRDSAALASVIAEQMKRESLADLLQGRLDRAKGGAEIQYQEGFAPQEDSESAGAADAGM